jgi:hypothetical protein
MRLKKTNVIEGLGLSLILLSFFVQMIETDIESDILEYRNYQIHKKLDYIWSVVSTDYAKKYPETGVYKGINFQSFCNDYKIYSEDKEDISIWEELVKYEWFIYVRLTLFILGSILVIIPKFSLKNTE